MRRNKPLRRSATLKRGPALRRSKPAPVIAADLWRDGMGTKCKVCKLEAILLRKPTICGGRLEAHHIIAKQTLKRRGFADHLLDHRNRLTICQWRHERHTDGREPIPRQFVPQAAWEFAEELNLTWWVEKHYPLVVCRAEPA